MYADALKSLKLGAVLTAWIALCCAAESALSPDCPLLCQDLAKALHSGRKSGSGI